MSTCVGHLENTKRSRNKRRCGDDAANTKDRRVVNARILLFACENSNKMVIYT